MLAKQWNEELKDSGFIDAESDSKGERVLKQRGSNSYRQADTLERQTRLEYFLVVGQAAHNTLFKSKCDELIMLSHAEGISIKEIGEILKQKGLSKDRRTIRFIIRRYQREWGIRYWTAKQLYLKVIK